MGTLLQISMAVPLAEDTERLRAGLSADPALPAGAGLSAEHGPVPAPRRWSLASLAGGIAEISSPVPAAGLTAAALLILEAQRKGEPAAWMAAGDSLFYAPDLHGAGVDLAALPVVRVTGPVAGARAAEHLLRCGAFALLVLDLGRCTGRDALSSAVQVRLAALCRRHRAALLLLARTPEGTPPVASLATFRAVGVVQKTAFDRFRLHFDVAKNKHRGAGWNFEETFRGPDGLC